jgi:putative transposase
VFQNRYKSLAIEKDSYLLECGRYIERNPLKAGIVKKLEDYPYSSYSYYALGTKDALITPSPAYLDLERSDEKRRKIYKAYVDETRPQEEHAPSSFLSV